ncbi:hypothetical protein F2Q69_00027527 [Brassica cretica]|uniref:Uncharacterized protein n=1 Tax=Brassica cretica TaxID=69181 RepID=A0A8S9SA33_BRACR|nr:hypothetical protein F2Q69_00027527 [Brassica cretica]
MPADSVDDSSSVDSVADRSSPRRDCQMSSESSKIHERKREEALVENEIVDIMTRVHNKRLLCAFIKLRILFN